MDFVHLLMHALVEIPTTTTSMPITHYLPKNTTMDGSLSAYLFYPQASGHVHMPAGLTLSFHPLPTYGLLYVSRGSGQITFSGRQYPLSGNSFASFSSCTWRSMALR